MASLCMLDDDGTLAGRWEIGATPVAVGRGASADIVVDDPALSRRHFIILRQGQEYFLKDLKSQNGTWVDGKRAVLSRLHHHDCILAGRTVFLFKESAEHTVGVPHEPVAVGETSDGSHLAQAIMLGKPAAGASDDRPTFSQED